MNSNRRLSMQEDWIAVIISFLIIGFTLGGITIALPGFEWDTVQDFAARFSKNNFAGQLAMLWIFGFCIILIAFALKGAKLSWQYPAAYMFIFSITILAHVLTGHSEVKALGLEIVLFSLLVGLIISNVGRVPDWVKPLVQTELYIKIGLVLLGCGIIFGDIIQAGSLGLLQSLLVVLVVWQFGFWISKKFGLDDELRAMLSSAVAICGVSAAIATAGAIKGDSKKLSYIISLVLITAIPMMLFMPPIAHALGLTDAVAGAWLGGTIDTTGAVVAAGTILGDEALKYATVVKFSQNVLLGLAAFAISIYWTYTNHKNQERPTVKTIWDRFPKFVLGFMAASLLFSFLLPEGMVTQVKSPLKSLQTFWFAMAFTCIGLETKFVDIFKMDRGRPAYAFLIAQLFNILFTLLVAWLIFR